MPKLDLEPADLDLELLEDEAPAPRYNDELIAALPESERRRLDLLSEMAAERARGEKLSAEEAELARQEGSIERFTPSGILNQPERIMRALGGVEFSPEVPERIQPQTPIFPIKPPQGTNTMAGFGQLGVGLLNTFQTPEMIVTAPAISNPVGRALIGAEMGRHIPEQVARGSEVAGDVSSTPAERVVAIGEPVIASGMTALIGGTGQARTIQMPEAVRTSIEQAKQTGLNKSAAAAEKAIEVQAKVEPVIKGEPDAIQKTEAKAPVEEGSGVQLRQETVQASEAPIKPRLVPVLETASGKLWPGMSHTEAAASARAKINADFAEGKLTREQFIKELNEVLEADDAVDIQHKMLDLNTGKTVEQGPGRVQSFNLDPKETAANLKELQDKGIKPPKSDPLDQLRELPGTATTQEAMVLGKKVPKEALPQLEALAKSAADDANRIIAEVDAIPAPTQADLTRMSVAGNKSQLLNEAVEAAKGGEPAILAREKATSTESSGASKTAEPTATEPPPVEGVISGSAAEKWADQVLGQDPRTKARSLLDPVEEGKRIAAVAIKGAAVIERGIRDFTVWSAEMVRTYGPEIQKDLQRIYGMSNGFVEQSLKSRTPSPETAGESVKMRKSAERATTSPMVPEPVQERIQAAPESRYTQQSMQRVEEAVSAMPDGELAAIPRESDLYTAARLEQSKRLFEAGKNDAGYEIFVELEKEGTRLGQLINQFKLLKGSRPENVVAVINGSLKKAGKDLLTPEQSARVIKITTDAKTADAVLDTATKDWQKNPTAENASKAEAALDASNAGAIELQKFTSRFQPRSTSSILKSVLQGNLLTPISEVANVFGNMSFLPFRALDRTIASGIDMIDAAIRRKPRELTVQPLTGTAEALKGVGRGLRQVPGIIARGTGDVIKGESRAGLHPIQAWINQFARNPEMPTTGGKLTLKDRMNLVIEGTFGIPAEAMLRGLGSGDAPFKEAARARVTAEQLRLNNVPRSQWALAQRFPELFLPKRALDQIHSDTMRAVFQGESKVLNYLTNLAKSKGELMDFAVATVAPYKLTPWNIVREILSYNPVVAAAKSVYDATKGSSRDAKLNAGKFVVGSMLTATGAWLYNKGLLAPSLDERDEAQKARILSGNVLPPNHINISGLRRAMDGKNPTFQSGDETVDIFRAGGLAGSIFYMSANIGRDLERGEKVPDSEIWQSILRQSTLEQARFGMNQSFLSGVEGLLTAIKDGHPETFLKQWANTVGSIPLPNTLNNISRTMREYKPDVSAKTFNDRIENMLRSKLGFAGLDEYLPLKRDLWGRPMRETPEGRNAIFYHFFDISKNKQVTSDPVELELYQLWRKTGDSGVIPPIPQRNVTFAKTTYALTPEQYSRYAELVGGIRREIVDAMVINPEFHKSSDDEKIRLLERVYRKGNEAARVEFFDEFNGQLEARSGRAGFNME